MFYGRWYRTHELKITRLQMISLLTISGENKVDSAIINTDEFYFFRTSRNQNGATNRPYTYRSETGMASLKSFKRRYPDLRTLNIR